MVQYLPRASGWGLQQSYEPINFIRVTIDRVLPHNISNGHYLPCKIYCLV
jgi:hypothetical protein